MVTYVFYLILLQGQQNVLLYGFHRSKSELDVHSNFSSESFTTQFLREVSYDIVLTDRYLKYWLHGLLWCHQCVQFGYDNVAICLSCTM